MDLISRLGCRHKPQSDDFKGVNRQVDELLMDFNRHQVLLEQVCAPGLRQPKTHLEQKVAAFAVAFIQADNQSIAILSGLDGLDDDIRRVASHE
jgi:hypothetical protein